MHTARRARRRCCDRRSGRSARRSKCGGSNGSTAGTGRYGLYLRCAGHGSCERAACTTSSPGDAMYRAALWLGFGDSRCGNTAARRLLDRFGLNRIVRNVLKTGRRLYDHPPARGGLSGWLTALNDVTHSANRGRSVCNNSAAPNRPHGRRCTWNRCPRRAPCRCGLVRDVLYGRNRQSRSSRWHQRAAHDALLAFGCCIGCGLHRVRPT